MRTGADPADAPPSALDALGPATRTWFRETFDRPTPVQEQGWSALAAGESALLLAPTGSGKTLAAMLAGIDRAMRLPPDAEAGVRVLYVSPLKALVHDVERNLRAPLVGILRTAERLGAPYREVRVDVRTGDTPQKEREAQRRSPGEILVTTPESLFLLLGSRARATLATVETVIVDEVHAIAATKRGTHLALSLERLAEVAQGDPQRVGLSATVRPPEDVAAYLGGDRPVRVIDTSEPPSLDLEIVVPVPDMADVRPRDLPAGAPAPEGQRLGVWPAVYPELVELIRAHRSTIVFVNSRGLCERLAGELNDLAEEELVLAHHGSVSREKRQAMEEALKRGELRAIVATSSLELGIDMGAVDLVVLVESPGSVARGLQRVGRAGHAVGRRSEGRVFPKFPGDLLECAAVGRRMLAGAIEPLRVPRNALDVLAQQLVAMVVDRERSVDELEALVRRAHPYRELTRSVLVSVLDMLSGRYPSDEFVDLRPRLAWDRTRDVLTARRGTDLVSRMNAGTIPDRGLYHVHAGHDGPRVGELDEEMVAESRAGDVVVLGASSWRILEIDRDRVVVAPAPGEPGRLPFWRGDGLGRPIELGAAVGALTAELEPLDEDAMVAHLRATAPLDELAARNLARHVAEQRAHAGCVPTDTRIVVERFRDELGDWRVCILTPFGRRVHTPWALALRTSLSARSGFEVSTMDTDDGIVLSFADGEELPSAELLLPDPDELEELVVDQLNGSALFGTRFRENAARALLLPRRNPRRRSPLYLQRLKSKALLGAVLRYPDFPIVLETYRECLRDVFDLPALEGLLRGVRDRSIRVEEVETESASPFARSLAYAYVATYLYEYDAPLAERRTQALSLDRALLRDLLGDAELRELLDVEAIESVERSLQALEPGRRARDADELSDVLRRLGALREEELAARADGDAGAWLADLEGQRRAARIQLAGQLHWIAAEDAGLYRDAVGANPPGGLPDSFLAPVLDAFDALVQRHARTHGPFAAAAVGARLGATEGRVQDALARLERAGRVVRGAIDPRSAGVDWCDADVLRRIKRATLAKLRGEIAPVGATALPRFLARWQGLEGRRGEGLARLEEALTQLEGLALPWSAWIGSVLPRRVPGFEPGQLDELCARGELVWIGRAPLGASDGKLAFARRGTAAHWLDPEPAEDTPERGPLHAALLEHLETRGASFTTRLERAARERVGELRSAEFEAALWDLVWSGAVTNDTCLPLRELGRSARRGRRGGALAGGRWSLVRELDDDRVSPTERAHARAQALLERYGVVTRELVLAESTPGGFAALYPVLRAMEEAGRIRRGDFLDAATGAQFALPGAVDRLRDCRDDEVEEVRVIEAIDPACPWGAALAWPAALSEDPGRPRRVAGALVVAVDGAACVYVAPSRRAITLFAHPGDAAARARGLRALAELPSAARRKSLVVEKIDGVPAMRSPHAALLESAGFVADYRGWIPAR